MKLVLIIIQNDDSTEAVSALTKEGFFITKLATTGAFLSSGNTTLLIGTKEDRIPKIKEILSKTCVGTAQAEPSVSAFVPNASDNESVGGATMFVLNVESFEKI